jgi:LAO/AO transport system kinase
MLSDQLPALLEGDFRTLARLISAVENAHPGYEALLEQLPSDHATRVVGLTGPPGAGKSTVADGLIAGWLAQEKKIAVLAVDPSSPFHRGALLGDRVRMARHYNDPRVFIRSLASRGSLGGTHPEMIGISTLVAAAGFDYLLIETVGVGQSEVEIAALADTTVVVLVPESGDEIQTMKAGLMEIADIFVVNKSDHGYADDFARNLRNLVGKKRDHGWAIPVIKTIATTEEGIGTLQEKIEAHAIHAKQNTVLAIRLLAQKAARLIQTQRMQDISIAMLETQIKKEKEKGRFNLYRFAEKFK